MKKKFLLFLLLILTPCFVFADEEINSDTLIFKHSNIISEESENLMYRAEKLEDGYIVLNCWLDYSDWVSHTYVKKIDNDGKTIWENEYTASTGTWIQGEQTGIYLGKENDVYISNNSMVIRINLSNGELLNQNSSIGCYKTIEYGDNLLCVGSGVFYQPYLKRVANNKLFILDKELNVLKSVDFYDRSEYIMAAVVENETIYALTFYRDASRNYYYWLKTLDKDLNEINSLTLNGGDFSSSGSINFEKIGDDFYYVAQSLSKIDSDGNITYISGGDYANGADYTDIEIIGDYVLLAGLYNDGENNLSALVEVYNKNMELKQTININSDFEQSNSSYASGGMAITKGISVTEKGFVASGLLNSDVSFLAEYQFLYDIASKTDGNGDVEVVSQALSGDMITFRVSPRSGYKLSTLTVTNEELESVVFTEDDLILNSDGTVSVSVNSFTMPASNVEIVASFEKIPENPNTFDNIVFYTGMFIVSISLIGGLVLYRRRHS